MYLMYVDESGDSGLLGSPTRYFVVSGIVLHELREFCGDSLGRSDSPVTKLLAECQRFQPPKDPITRASKQSLHNQTRF